jgi:hypothetical protein
MKRRGFLKALLALPVVAALPGLWRSLLGWKSQSVVHAWDQDYVCIIHPAMEADLRAMFARDEWRDRWRQYRRSLRNGEMKELTPEQIMADWKSPFAQTDGVIRKYSGMNFIVSERV